MRCRPYLVAELALLTRVRVVIALGRIAFDAFLATWQEAGHPARKPRPQFGHAGATTLEGGLLLLSSYHPSPAKHFHREAHPSHVSPRLSKGAQDFGLEATVIV